MTDDAGARVRAILTDHTSATMFWDRRRGWRTRCTGASCTWTGTPLGYSSYQAAEDDHRRHVAAVVAQAREIATRAHGAS